MEIAGKSVLTANVTEEKPVTIPALESKQDAFVYKGAFTYSILPTLSHTISATTHRG